MEPVSAQGMGGWVRFDGQRVVLARRGVFARLTGMTGERTLELAQIEGVVLSPATRAKGTGYLQFLRRDDPLRHLRDKALGVYGRQDALTTARLDEYALPYGYHQREEFQALAGAVTAALSG